MSKTKKQVVQAFVRAVLKKSALDARKNALHPSSVATMPSPDSVPQSTSATARPRSVPECRHIRAAGHRCRSIAMKGTRYCYHHARAYQRKRIHQMSLDDLRSTFASNPKSIPDSAKYDDRSAQLFQSLDLPMIEDATSLQVFYNSLIHATLKQQIGERRAATVHRMLRSFLVLMPSLRGDRVRPISYEDIVVDRDPEPLANPYAPEFTMENVIAVRDEDLTSSATQKASEEASKLQYAEVPPITDVAKKFDWDAEIKKMKEEAAAQEEEKRAEEYARAEHDGKEGVFNEYEYNDDCENCTDDAGCPRFAAGLDANLGTMNMAPLGIPLALGFAFQKNCDEKHETNTRKLDVAVPSDESSGYPGFPAGLDVDLGTMNMAPLGIPFEAGSSYQEITNRNSQIESVIPSERSESRDLAVAVASDVVVAGDSAVEIDSDLREITTSQQETTSKPQEIELCHSERTALAVSRGTPTQTENYDKTTSTALPFNSVPAETAVTPLRVTNANESSSGLQWTELRDEYGLVLGPKDAKEVLRARQSIADQTQTPVSASTGAIQPNTTAHHLDTESLPIGGDPFTAADSA